MDELRGKTYRVLLTDREEEELRVAAIRSKRTLPEFLGDVLRSHLEKNTGDQSPGHSKKVAA